MLARNFPTFKFMSEPFICIYGSVFLKTIILLYGIPNFLKGHHFRFATGSSHVHTEVTSGDTAVDVTPFNFVWTREFLLLALDCTGHQMEQLITMLR